MCSLPSLEGSGLGLVGDTDSGTQEELCASGGVGYPGGAKVCETMDEFVVIFATAEFVEFLLVICQDMLSEVK